MRLDPSRLARIATWQDRYIAEKIFPGSSVLICQDGQEVYYNDCGQMDIERGQAWSRDAIVRIYSMTKPLTSLAMMMLVEEGLATLSDPVADYIPEFADARALIPGATHIDQTEPCRVPNLRELLTHTSGLSIHST